MAWNAAASSLTNGRPLRPRRQSRALALLLLASAVSGCEAMERMDYLDRIFDPSLRSSPAGALRPGPIAAMEPVRNPADGPVAADREPQPDRVVAMEPVWNPADRHQPAADRASQQAAVRAAEPRPSPPSQPATDAEARTRSLVRQNPWLTRFWMELTPAQRARVERRLQRGNVRLAAEQAEPAAIWDPMGLADRVKLVFGGGGAPPERPAPADGGDGSIWAAGRP